MLLLFASSSCCIINENRIPSCSFSFHDGINDVRKCRGFSGKNNRRRKKVMNGVSVYRNYPKDLFFVYCTKCKLWKCGDCLAKLSDNIKDNTRFDAFSLGLSGQCMRFLQQADWRNTQLTMNGAVTKGDLCMKYGIRELHDTDGRKIGKVSTTKNINY